MPWTDANGISIHYELAGQGASVVLLHEMGGTLASWDGIAPALAQNYRVLRYDQRDARLTEKVRAITTEILLAEDLRSLAGRSRGSAAALSRRHCRRGHHAGAIYMTKYPDRIASFTFCNPFTGADPSRVAAFRGHRGARRTRRPAGDTRPRSTIPGRPTSATAPPTPPTAGATVADPVCFAALNRSIAQPDVTHLAKEVAKPPGDRSPSTKCVRRRSARPSPRPSPTRASS